jgi:very-short-patch-repair endonuclease
VKDVNGQEGLFNHKDYFETEVYKFLLTKFKQEDVTREKTFPGMMYKNPLRVDFYIQSINTVIEADGAQHWDKTNRYYTELNTIRDSIKEEYLQQNAIRLIRIPYRRNFSTSYFNSFI